MRQYVIALVDCDCFFVSCERKDNPDLQGKPVCVMTGASSKGIIVSRSKEAKALGIKMGQPYFQIKPNFRAAIYIPARWLLPVLMPCQIQYYLLRFWYLPLFLC